MKNLYFLEKKPQVGQLSPGKLMQRPQDLIFVIKSGNFPRYLPVVSNSRREEVVKGTKGTIERDNLESEKTLFPPAQYF